MTFDLNTIWFMLVGVLLTGYAILDGFDLGVGALHLFSKQDVERRLFINAIGPVWDGNEVWLVTGGGALFAAFPEVYATAFSGFYMALILLLFALIFRAVSIECRSKQSMPWWRQTWDTAFSVGSVIASLLIGVALGNVALGIPLGSDHEFAGSFFGLLNPYALLVGITTVALFTMHGALYLLIKTEGDLHDRVRRWAGNALIVFIVCYVAATAVTLLFATHMVEPIQHAPWLLVVPLLTVLAIANIAREMHRGNDWRAFLSSSAVIVTLMALFGIGMHPNLIFSNPDPGNSLTIYNAASSVKTLGIMLIIAAIGMPLVLAYTVSIYRIFRGKVKLDSSSY